MLNLMCTMFSKKGVDSPQANDALASHVTGPTGGATTFLSHHHSIATARQPGHEWPTPVSAVSPTGAVARLSPAPVSRLSPAPPMSQSPQGRGMPMTGNISGGMPTVSQHGRPAPQPGPTAWNHLQVPSFYAGRQPQHAHMSSEHPLLTPHPPTWHTPSTEPATPLFSLQQMLGSERGASLGYGRPTPASVDLSLPPRNLHSPRNGNNRNGESSSPISLSVRDAKQINSLADRRQSLQELVPIKRPKKVDSILERLNSTPGSVIVSASHGGSHDESSDGSQPGLVVSSSTREEDTISPVSNDDSLDGSKSRRKRKPSKTVRMPDKLSDDEKSRQLSDEDNLLNLTKGDSNMSVDLSKPAIDSEIKDTKVIFDAVTVPVSASVDQVSCENEPTDNLKSLTSFEEGRASIQQTEHTPVIVKRRSSTENVSPPEASDSSPKRTRRKTCSESETIDNIAAMIASTEQDEVSNLSNEIDSNTKPISAVSCDVNSKINLVNVLASPLGPENEKKSTPTDCIDEKNSPESDLIVQDEQKLEVESSDAIVNSENVTLNQNENVLKTTPIIKVKSAIEINNSSSIQKSNTLNFVEVENQLEKMFAGLEELDTTASDPADATVSVDQNFSTERDRVTSTSTEVVSTGESFHKRISVPRISKINSLQSSECESNESTPRKKHKGARKYNDDFARRKVNSGNKNSVKGKNKKSLGENKKTHRVNKFKPDVSQQKDVYSYDSGSNASSNRSRGPFVQITGPRESPISVDVVNAPCNDDDTEKNMRLKVKKSFHDDNEYRRKVRAKGLHSSTLSIKYDAHTTDTSWICVFCKRGPHTGAIDVANRPGPSNVESVLSSIGYGSGDLFGPYIIASDCSEYRESLENIRDAKMKRETRPEPFVGGIKAKFMSKKAKKRHLQVNQDQVVHEMPSEPYQGAALEGMIEAGINKYEVWAHEDCIVWGPGVYLSGPRIIGLEGAVWSSCGVRCERCGKWGAAVSCLARGCGRASHVVCAAMSGWSLDESTYKAYCQRHKKVV